STARTLTPRLWASRRALAMGADVKLYACTRIWVVAAFTSRTTASVAPPLGEKYTATRAGENVSAACPTYIRPSMATRIAMQPCGALDADGYTKRDTCSIGATSHKRDHIHIALGVVV